LKLKNDFKLDKCPDTWRAGARLGDSDWLIASIDALSPSFVTAVTGTSSVAVMQRSSRTTESPHSCPPGWCYAPGW